MSAHDDEQLDVPFDRDERLAGVALARRALADARAAHAPGGAAWPAAEPSASTDDQRAPAPGATSPPTPAEPTDSDAPAAADGDHETGPTTDAPPAPGAASPPCASSLSEPTEAP